jgi:hypothetical protein
VKESSWHRLVELAKSLGTGIRLREDMREQSFGDVFTMISRTYFRSPAVYRDQKCRSLPFWKRHAYRDKSYSDAVCASFRLFCRLEVEKIAAAMPAGGFIQQGGVADFLDEPWAVVEMLRRARSTGIDFFTAVGPGWAAWWAAGHAWPAWPAWVAQPPWPSPPDYGALPDPLNN